MKSKKYRGGSGSPASAWGYVYNTVGDGYTQFRNALTLQPGDNLGTIHNNDIEPKSNLNAQSTQSMPSKTDLSLIQKAGGKRRRRGGNMGAIVNQALAPLSLLALQHSYAKRKRITKSKSKKSKKSKKSRRTRKYRK
jgi:hypothetical protein